MIIIGGLRINFDRYYLPIVFLFGIGVGVLAGEIWALGVRLLDRRAQSTVDRPQPALQFGAAASSQQPGD